ncbi:uncharacterized protein LOC116257582 isoform X2 [Nymphaea colorata]|nr:uncharacterized protein LOC116257582 isoform X2 [Nymphaea colorata]
MGSRRASEIVSLLHLQPHPEGGYFAETFRDSSIRLQTSSLPPEFKVDRPISTCIYFLLPSGSVSHLHRIPCAETWHFYMGEPLTVFELREDGTPKMTVLGPDLEAGQHLQYTVPPNVWFGSFPTKDVLDYAPDGSSVDIGPSRDPDLHFSLVGCTCAPAFQFEDFELPKFSQLLAVAPNVEPFLRYLALPN